MRILYIIDFFHPHVGGAPTFFKNLAENVSRMGHRVTIVTTHANGTKSVEKYKGMKIYRFGKTREQFLIGATLFLSRSRERYDVVHTSTYSAMIPSYAFSLFRKVPEVLSVHEIWTLKEWTEFARAKGLFYFVEERLLFTLPFDAYVSPSEHTKTDLEKTFDLLAKAGVRIPRSRIRVIPHGVDEKIFSPRLKKARGAVRAKYLIGEDEFVGCFVGKATVFKGIDYLLDALEAAMRKIDMRFIFVLSRLHESGYRKFMKRVTESDVLRKNIIVAEASSDHSFVSRIVAACDFLAMPSLTEGFGFAAAEAAAIGIPVIATRSTSLTEVLEENENAVFIEPRSPRAIADAIEKIARDEKLRSRLSRGKRFRTWREVAREYVKVYQDVIRKHKEAGI